MNKKVVWLLTEQRGMLLKLIGIVSNEEVSNKFCNLYPRKRNSQSYNVRQALYLDDPELLNRIAKGESDDSL